MKNRAPMNQKLFRNRLGAAVAFAILAAPAAHAFEFSKGELTGSLDTTVSMGYSWRVEERDPNLVGKSFYNPLLCNSNVLLSPGVACSTGFPGSAAQIAAPGRFSANRDDGNLKYDDGDAIASTAKITSELSLSWRDWGAFTRATYFYDFENADRTDLTQEAKDRIGERFRLLDAFVYKNFKMGDNNGTVRLGRQVVSWGESTFIQQGINVVNPVDLSALRVAGAELKEAFLPIDMLFGSISLTENVSLEALYMFEFEEIEVDAAGTYFSSNDFATPGGEYVMLGFGVTPQPVVNPELYRQVCLSGPAGVLATDLPYGALNPTVATIGCASSVPRNPTRYADDDGQYGAALRWYAEGLMQTEFGFFFLNYHSRLPLLSGVAVTGSSATSGRYFAEYPEDIQLYGISWNTSLPGGIAWQGEVSYRPNAPLQVDDVELLFAALSPLNAFIPAPAATFQSQLGSASFGQEIRGWREHHVSQLQMTFTKVFGRALGADQIAVVGELGGTNANLPPESVLRYEGEGTDTGGGCDLGDVIAAGPAGLGLPGCARNPLTLNGGFPTSFSWGYRLAARADYNGVWGTSMNLSPRIAFNHDVDGITPGPGGNFLEGRKSLTLGAELNYLNKWVFDASYTRFSGAEPYNQIADRDFASVSVKYLF